MWVQDPHTLPAPAKPPQPEASQRQESYGTSRRFMRASAQAASRSDNPAT
jgi:hypothetical protein